MDDRNYGGTALESRVQFAPETAPFYLYPAFHQLIRGPTCLSALPPLFPFIPHGVSSLNLASFYFAEIARILAVFWPHACTCAYRRGKMRHRQINLRRHSPDIPPPFKFCRRFSRRVDWGGDRLNKSLSRVLIE